MFCKLFEVVLSLVLFGGINIKIGECHTVAICYTVDDSSVTVYAGTYHSNRELFGGVIFDSTRYDFTSWVLDDNESPDGVSDLTCFRCSTYSGNIDYWQVVTVDDDLENGDYTVTTTSDSLVEVPYCTSWNVIIDGVATVEPTSAPTQAPTWVAPCLNDPCDCYGSSEGFEDEFCEICHSNGCDKCIGSNGEYFKLDYNFPCKGCQDVFGIECLHCQDFDGCGQCDSGYKRVYDASEDLHYCEALSPTTSQPTGSPVIPPVTTCTDGINECASANCNGAGENPYCSNQQTWGCPSCNSGYFLKSHQYPCVECGTLTGCIGCADFQGCTSCDSGYTWYWDSSCSIGRCQ